MTIGYLIFGHISMKINMENVRAVQSRMICSSRCPDNGKFYFKFYQKKNLVMEFY